MAFVLADTARQMLSKPNGAQIFDTVMDTIDILNGHVELHKDKDENSNNKESEMEEER